MCSSWSSLQVNERGSVIVLGLVLWEGVGAWLCVRIAIKAHVLGADCPEGGFMTCRITQIRALACSDSS